MRGQQLRVSCGRHVHVERKRFQELAADVQEQRYLTSVIQRPAAPLNLQVHEEMQHDPEPEGHGCNHQAIGNRVQVLVDRDDACIYVLFY